MIDFKYQKLKLTGYSSTYDKHIVFNNYQRKKKFKILLISHLKEKENHFLLLTLVLMAEMAVFLCILLLHTQKITLPQHTTPPINLQLN